MSFTLLGLLLLLLAVAALLLKQRRDEVSHMARGLEELARAKSRGSHAARLQHPHVDLNHCIGCGTCVRACPEEGVLELIHGQAVVVHGARCVGHGRCAAECPTGAIALTLGDLSERRDIPALSQELEAPGTPGLFLSGEVTGFALIRTAIVHGTSVADEVARRVAAANGSARRGGELRDLCIVGAGPAGLACALRAKERGLDAVLVEQAELGGTVSKYPRRKLVMTQPVELPLHGRLKRTTYSKEELLELWEEIVGQHDLALETGHQVEGVAARADGTFDVRTSRGSFHARNVCLALGRRGSPRKLGVPGEELSKVAYSLLDASSYRHRRILVVGGGDSAIEAALGLAEQEGNQVTLSYRKDAFFRVKPRNEARFDLALREGRVQARFGSEVRAIDPERVQLRVDSGDDLWLENDEVFVFAGGIPPFELLEACGVSFDPADRPAEEPLLEQTGGLLRALLVALALGLVALVWTAYRADYYTLPISERPRSPWHAALRPSSPFGLALGAGATVAILANLAYLFRRSLPRLERLGSLRGWMTAHVVTGILALLLALVHAAMLPRDSLGGHAFLALCVLVATGAVGRYFYSFVPRTANGRELALEEAQGRLAALSREWDEDRGRFADYARREVQALVEAGHWRGSFVRRLGALLHSHRRLSRTLSRLRVEATAEDLPAHQIDSLTSLARRAHRAALATAHYEDLRGLLSTWRYVHRWAALVMVLLVAFHVANALRFGGLLG